MSNQQSESFRRDHWTPEGSYQDVIEAIKMQRPNECRYLLSLLAIVEEDRERITHYAKPEERQSNLENLEASLDQFFTALEGERWLRGFWASLFMRKEDCENMDRTRSRLHQYIEYVRIAQREAASRLSHN